MMTDCPEYHLDFSGLSRAKGEGIFLLGQALNSQEGVTTDEQHKFMFLTFSQDSTN